jgi:hypothetical protein
MERSTNCGKLGKYWTVRMLQVWLKNSNWDMCLWR